MRFNVGDNREFIVDFRYGNNKTTSCFIHEVDSSEIYIGIAELAENDRFDRISGRRVALTRALNNLPRDIRSAIWDGYFKASPKSKRKGGFHFSREWSMKQAMIEETGQEIAAGSVKSVKAFISSPVNA